MECKTSESVDDSDWDVDEAESNFEVQAKKSRASLPKSETPLYIQMGFISKMVDRNGNLRRSYQCLTCDTVLKNVNSKNIECHR